MNEPSQWGKNDAGKIDYFAMLARSSEEKHVRGGGNPLNKTVKYHSQNFPYKFRISDKKRPGEGCANP